MYMKKYMIIIISLFLFGCVSSQQPKKFNVKPTFCYDGECFSIEQKNNLLLFNTSMPEGEYKIEQVITNISSDKEEAENNIISMRVQDDIVTFEIKNLLVKYNQKNQKIIHIVDKSGVLTPSQTNSLKGLFKKALGLYLSPYASSGEIIPSKYNLNFGKANMEIDAFCYVHGETYYNDQKYPLVEIKGEGKLRVNGSSIPVIYSGYFIKEPTRNIYVKSVIDMTLKIDNTSQRMRIIEMQKIVQ